MPTTFDDDFLPGHSLSAVEINKIKNNTVVQVDTASELDTLDAANKSVKVAYVVDEQELYVRTPSDSTNWEILIGEDQSDQSGGGINICYDTWEDLVNCSPSNQDHLVLLDGAARPTKYVGNGRPDVDGVPGTPVAGDTYTCTNPSDPKNIGARLWRYDGNDWTCVDGFTGWWQLEDPVGSDLFAIETNNGNDDIKSQFTSTVRWCRTGQYQEFTAYIWLNQAMPDNKYLNIKCQHAFTGMGPAQGDLVVPTQRYTAGGVIDNEPMNSGRGRPNSIVMIVTPRMEATHAIRFSVFYKTRSSWPNESTMQDFTTDLARATKDIWEKAAQENPELAEQLREELKSLKSEGTE